MLHWTRSVIFTWQHQASRLACLALPGGRLGAAGLLCVMVMALSACGGGGGGGGSSPTDTPGTPPPVETPSTPPPVETPGEPPPVENPQAQTPLVQSPLPPPVETPSEPPSLPPPPSPDPPSCIQTQHKGCLELAEFDNEAGSLAPVYGNQGNFQNQWGLGTIRADRAYAHLELIKGSAVSPGEGVTLGFVDTGIDRAHRLLASSTIHEVFLSGVADETGTRFSHGTAVASVAAAPRLPGFTNAGHGVAWGADIVMFAIETSSGSSGYSPISLSGFAGIDSFWTSTFSSALAWRDGTQAVDFLNLSVGHEGIIDNYSEADLRSNFGNAIQEMAQQSAADKTVLVWAAGNAHGKPCTDTTSQCRNGQVDAASVEVLPGLVARIGELQGHTVAVVAIGEDGAITDFSNRCGIAAEWCLAAPGEDILTAYFGPHEGNDGFRGLATVDGTSFAAPMVTGGLAVMKHLFRDQLSNTDLLARLLATADSGGIYSDRGVYGHGLMDLAAATSPVGVLTVTQGDRVGTAAIPLQTSQFQPGTAFGDGFTQSLAGHEIAAFDALGAPFWFDLHDFTTTVTGPSMAAQLRDFLAPAPGPKSVPMYRTGFTYGDWVGRHSGLARWSLGFLDVPTGAEEGHFALAEQALALSFSGQNGLSATAFTTEGDLRQRPASGAALTWRPADSVVGLHAGWMGERETLLGSMAEGAFGKLAADAFFVGIEADTDYAGWRIGANAEIGTVRPVAGSGLITGVSSLTTSAFALHASRLLADEGTFRVSLSQPLRIERGGASLNVPAGRTRDGEVVRNPVTASLVPSGRQINLAAHWHRALTLGELRLGTVWTHEPEHRATADPEITLLSGWLVTF